MSTGVEIDVSEVIEALDPLGKALFDAALERVKVRHLQARIDELERQQAPDEQQEGA